jgi:hypothetical protein
MDKVELFLGRMQPPHKGHEQIIKGMKNPYVIIVRGKGTGEDKKRNPFSAEIQKTMLNDLFPNVPVSISPDGFITGILNHLRKQGKEVTKIYAGADRIVGYESTLAKTNEKAPPEEQFHPKFSQTERVASATEVRNALFNNDLSSFKSKMPKALWGFYGSLRNALRECFEIPSFKTWLLMEDGGATTTTDNVVGKEEPLLKKKIAKRKAEIETKIEEKP